MTGRPARTATATTTAGAAAPCPRSRAVVAFLSGYSNEAVAHQGMLSPGATFVGKPVTAEGLLRRLRELLIA